MKRLVAKIWVPALLVFLAAVQSFGIDAARAIDFRKLADSLILNRLDDTVAATDLAIDSMKASQADSLFAADSVLRDSTSTDSLLTSDTTMIVDTLILSPRDTIRIPDSLEFKDPFKFKYYIAIKDSLTRVQVRDSLIQASCFLP